ncbi:hypothetical protein GCM10025874_25170 [Arenivirga flava]|uniref:Uncharacterized protein n=1 Tax=Arenivirga flava TaxID=1930060 RepID=A0AA37XA35_9MICO|nr:hypothetical protein GCM10025874_25170 [Arenivirga flava]
MLLSSAESVTNPPICEGARRGAGRRCGRRARRPGRDRTWNSQIGDFALLYPCGSSIKPPICDGGGGVGMREVEAG